MRLPRIRKNVIPRGEEGRRIKGRFEDENACKRCGKCCYQGFIVKGLYIMIPELPCRYLKPDGNGRTICEVYENRDKIDWCNTANVKTVKEGLFPPDCAYVQGVINYRGKILPPPEQEERINRELFKRVKRMSCPEPIRLEDWLNFLSRLMSSVGKE